MKKGWFVVEEELPPLGLEVIVSYPNIAYGGYCMRCLATRIDEDTMISTVRPDYGKGMKLKTKRNKGMTNTVPGPPPATHWAYNNGQKLPEITDGLCCCCHSKKENKK